MFHAVGVAALAFGFGGVGDYRVPPQPLPAPAEISAAAAGRSYGGHTADNEPIAIRVSGRRVTELVLDMRAPCDSKQTFPVASVVRRGSGKSSVPQLKGGRISRKGRFVATGTGSSDLGDSVAVVTMGASGKLGARSASGRVAVSVTVVDKATNQPVDHCAASAKWTQAAPERRIYSGATEQAAPVVLQLSRNRKSVQAFWFGLFADCTPSGSIAPVDVITSFRIRSGRFGADFSDEGTDGAGGTIHLDFSFHGRASRRAASGTLSVTATDRDAQGNTVSTCPSGSLKWSALQ